MKSVEIYRVLNFCLKSDFKSLYYKKHKLERLGWFKIVGANYIIISFACNHRGWEPFTGTDFEIHIGLHDKISEISWPTKHTTLNKLLSENDLRELVDLQNAVIQKFKKYDVDIYKNAHPTADQYFVDYLHNQFEPLKYPPEEFDTRRMRCYDLTDGYNWGDYFHERIKSISRTLEDEWK